MSSSSSSENISSSRNIDGFQYLPERMQEVIFYLKGSEVMHKGRVLTFAQKPTKVLWKCDRCEKIYRTCLVAVWNGSYRTRNIGRRGNSEF